ncbi:type II secretion system protein [Microbacterium deminutum]|uniref:Type II secretion system protein n=1 Tax=Microbacterium deminutum TaxID=344164 RepID=A0ABP5BPR8_9MICO
MRCRDTDGEGFGLVEVIIAMVLLAVIAAAILPVLWSGIRFSSEQATVATATRQLNALIEDARQSPSCSSLPAIIAPHSFSAGDGLPYATTGTLSGCASGSAASVSLVAKRGSATLATVSALVYVP